MARELIERGVTGEQLVRVVAELTGLPDHDVYLLIAIESGQSRGDVAARSRGISAPQ